MGAGRLAKRRFRSFQCCDLEPTKEREHLTWDLLFEDPYCLLYLSAPHSTDADMISIPMYVCLFPGPFPARSAYFLLPVILWLSICCSLCPACCPSSGTCSIQCRPIGSHVLPLGASLLSLSQALYL